MKPRSESEATEGVSSRKEPLAPVAILEIAIWCGLAAAAGTLVRRYSGTELLVDAIGFPTYLMWMAPAADCAIALALALPLLLLGLVVRPLRRPLLAVTVLASVAWFALGLEFLPFVRRDALALLAFGLAFQTGRFAERRRAGFAARVALRRVLLGLAVAGIAIWSLAYAWSRGAERAAAETRQPAPPPEGVNVLLVTLDVLRAQNTSLNGYERPTTPGLVARAGESLVFDRAYAPTSWTLPGHAGIFTGLEAEKTGTSWQKPLADSHLTLAEVFRDRGYETAGFAANWDYCTWRSGLAQGFLHYEDYVVRPETVLNCTRLGAYLSRQTARFTGHAGHPYAGRKRAERLTDDVIAWLDGCSSGRPFFAFVNYIDMHEPFDAPPPWDRMFDFRAPEARDRAVAGLPGRNRQELLAKMDRYDGAIAYVDHHLARLLRALEERGLLDSTLVVITSDHGETFDEHDSDGHGNGLYPELLQVPLLMRLPGRIPAGARVAERVGLVDLGRTILDLAFPEARPGFPGRSLLPLMTGAPDWQPTPLRFQVDERLRDDPRSRNRNRNAAVRAVIDGDHEFIRNEDPALGDELYDLAEDPFAQRNLIDEPGQAEQRKRLEGLLRQE